MQPPSRPRRTGFWGLFLFLWLIPQGHTQEALTIHAEDLAIEKTPGQEGFHLFIRKKPGLSSVLLTESTKDRTGREDTYSYRFFEWNAINGDELRIVPSSSTPIKNLGWFLMDSSPEYHPSLGEAFHIYIPPVISYGYPDTRHGTITVEDGIFINIRTFALPYVDYSGPFKDNPFTLSIIQDPAPDLSLPMQDRPDSKSESPRSPPARPDLFLLPSPDPEPVQPVIRLIPPDLPPLPAQDAPADLSPSPPAGQEGDIPPDSAYTRPSEEILQPLETLQSPLKPQPLPKEEGPVFAPVIHAQGGVAIFFPGPEGRSIGLKNNYDPIGAITLTNWFTPIWGIRLGFDRDPLLMNRLFARAAWDISFIGLEAGPYFGLLNTDTGHISPGLSLVLHLRMPRWNLFSSFQYDTPFGKDLIGPGDYIQSSSEIKAGLMLPWGRLTLSMIDRNSTLQDDLGLEIISYWIRYNLALEITQPLAPLGLRLDLGYQKLHWTYHISLSALDYEYYDVYAGLEASYRIGLLSLLLGLEAPLYPFTYPQLQSLEDPQAPFFGQIKLGFGWTFPPQ